jgi:hypothetical protein
VTVLPAVRKLERRTWFAPLGVYFWNPSTNLPITDGLSVTVVSLADPRIRILAVPNPSNVYVIHAFPGLPRDGAAYPQPDDAPMSPPPSTPTGRPIRIEVRDPAGHYLPVDLLGAIPAYGLFAPTCATASPPDSPLAPARAVNLYPGAAQPTTGARAVVRADLRDAATDRPVAWALASVVYRGATLGRAVSDADGRLTLVFPFPELATPRIVASPAPATPPTLRSMATWDVSLHITSSPAVSNSTVPEFCALHAQATARVLAARSPTIDLTDISIGLGRETVVRSAGERHLYLVPGS